MSRKRGGFALILLGVVLAVGVAMLVFNQAQRAAETARMESVDVLVAAQDIPERSVMVAPFVSVKRMLPASLPPGAMDRPEQVLGKMTVGPILAGDFILPGKLVDSDGRSGLAYVVPKGKVVITMPASDILSTGAIHPATSSICWSPSTRTGRRSAPSAQPAPSSRSQARRRWLSRRPPRRRWATTTSTSAPPRRRCRT